MSFQGLRVESFVGKKSNDFHCREVKLMPFWLIIYSFIRILPACVCAHLIDPKIMGLQMHSKSCRSSSCMSRCHNMFGCSSWIKTRICIFFECSIILHIVLFIIIHHLIACSHVVVTYFRCEWYMLCRYTYLQPACWTRIIMFCTYHHRRPNDDDD